MPTGRGWLVLANGIGLWAVGRAFGTDAVEQLGVGLVALVCLAVIFVRSGRAKLDISRSVAPERVQAGRRVDVTLTLRNEGRRSAPLLLVEDTIPPGLSGRARFALKGIEAKGERRTGYGLKPARRGRYELGPMEVTSTDPFGVASIRTRSLDLSHFLTYPPTEQLDLPKDAGRRRTVTTSARRNPTGAQGEDFYTLREYAPGDDLRRIHWPATAKLNRYMIRQEETPWHARATILLDDRAGAYARDTWETAVCAAASLADLYHRSSYGYRLVGAVDPGVPTGRGSDHFHRCMDLLATIDMRTGTDPSDPLLTRLSELEAEGTAEGVLLVVTGTPSADHVRTITLCGRRYRLAVALTITGDPVDDALHTSMAALEAGGVRALALAPGETLTRAWGALWHKGASARAAEGVG